MRLLYEFDAAIRTVFLHSLDQHHSLFGFFFKFNFSIDLLLLKLLVIAALVLLSLLSCLLGFELGSGKCLDDGDIEGSLTLLVQHEEMMGQISKLSLKLEPVLFISHQLVDSCVAFGVDAIIMRVNQVTLNVAESLEFDPAHLLGTSSWSHGRIFGAVDEFTD